ncbi:hypothetical protein GCM10007207_02420 [Asaia siamensis]|uniref:Uncharacterized protein n=1 Tax=Asaia siamensis TaxID=110479 RepID=A0ABQ1L8I7_9PROT|nr:hypothetical protein AA0323_2387 [Asaia siamensis NRIC 0323]GGC20680.1 hypothetical protein GCM10007207_02420 [Asaia siamensis]
MFPALQGEHSASQDDGVEERFATKTREKGSQYPDHTGCGLPVLTALLCRWDESRQAKKG